MSSPSGREPDEEGWAVPKRIGYIAASEATHFVAAPLLAAAAITAIGVVLADGDKLRWPDATVFALTVCATLFVFSIQRSFNARAHLFNAADADDWFGTENRPPDTVLKQHQHAGFKKWRTSVRGATNAYNLGVVTLGLGACLALAPPENATFWQAFFRWAASGVAALSAGVEGISTARIWHSQRSGSL
ncbi:hypothetical protein [Streptomyces naphthomycinicus]|uniref:hypothetical protein n=1 Tax=Streptomyces naphthomycinicus TaxID=2872625 RepID=UPI001CEC9AD9|nr:hypothetical protein [Streptomyces sp. TML10]